MYSIAINLKPFRDAPAEFQLRKDDGEEVIPAISIEMPQDAGSLMLDDHGLLLLYAHLTDYLFEPIASSLVLKPPMRSSSSISLPFGTEALIFFLFDILFSNQERERNRGTTMGPTMVLWALLR
jgi:hypothetical protein